MFVFLWGIFVIVGPSEMMVRTFVDHVISFTTDFGVEMGLVTCPDILSAFLAWVAGRPLEECRGLVDRSRRLFRNCLRIVGWNHTLGSIMNATAAVTPTWPDVLYKIQRLCTFLRNETWRGSLRKHSQTLQPW